MASVSTTISYPVSLPTIPWDRGQQLVEGDPLALAFLGVYDNTVFSANVSFTIVPEEGDIAVYSITNIEATLPSSATKYDDDDNIVSESVDLGLSYSVVGSTVSISGEIQGLLNEYYTFVMKDGSVRDLPINNNEDWAAVVKWSVPPRKEVGVSYSFVVTYVDELLTEYQQTIVIPQWIYWSWQTSLQALNDFVKAGDI
jgi:hypothetical protein